MSAGTSSCDADGGAPDGDLRAALHIALAHVVVVTQIEVDEDVKQEEKVNEAVKVPNYVAAAAVEERNLKAKAQGACVRHHQSCGAGAGAPARTSYGVSSAV